MIRFSLTIFFILRSGQNVCNIFFSPSENHFTLQRLLLLHETRGIISLLAFKADINAKEISRSILNDHIIKKKKHLAEFFANLCAFAQAIAFLKVYFVTAYSFFFFKISVAKEAIIFEHC